MLPPKTEPHPKRSPLQGFLPFLWLALACLAGILVANSTQLFAWVWGVGFGLATLSLILAHILPQSLPFTHRLRRWTGAEQRLPRAVLLAIALLGGWRMAAALPKITPESVAYYNDRGTVQLVGVIVDAPDPRDTYTNISVQVDQLRPLEAAITQIKPIEVNGKVLVQVPPGEDWDYGDRVQISGSLETPFDSADFSYREYLARKGSAA